jgi:hypothetical protein
MAFNSNILNIPLDGTGTEIPTLNVTDPYEKYLITGANTTIGNYALVPTGTPQQGTTFLFKYKATTDITTNGNTFAIFGQALTQNQLLIELDIECYYTGSAWVVEVKPSLTTAFVESVNIIANAITTSTINNLAITTAKINTNAVTNAKLAQMANQTVKANISGALADPSDVAITALVSLGGWGLTGNAGTTVGTNFIGTTDSEDLLIKGGVISFHAAGNNSGTLGGVNTGFGYSALLNVTNNAFNNTAVGFESLLNLTTGDSNTAVGFASLASNTSGSENTGIGESSLLANTTGTTNTSVGVGTLVANTSGSSNTAVGNQALESNTTANNNTAIGIFSLGNNTTGANNTGIGSLSLSGLTTGSSNTGVGINAGVTVTTGSFNTFMGLGAGANSATSLNRIALGYNASATSDYQFAIPDDVTTIKFKGLTYTLPTALPGADAILHCSSTGVLTWV